MADNKIRTDIYILSGGTGASVIPEKYNLRNKKNTKSLEMSPSRKNPIPNQDINRLSTPKYQSIPPQ